MSTSGSSLPAAPSGRLGEAFVDAGLISASQLEQALRLQTRWGSRLGEIVLAQGWVRALPFYQTLARHLGVPFVNLVEHPAAPELVDDRLIEEYNTRQYLPWRRGNDGELIVACADPSPAFDALLRARYGENVRTVVTSKFDVQWHLQRTKSERITAQALDTLHSAAPQFSARTVFTRGQLVFAWLVVTVLLMWLAFAPMSALIAANAVATFFLLGIFALKFLLAWHGSTYRLDFKVSDDEVRALDDTSLPMYTILVPMYREANVLPTLAAALQRMDYPQSKLDVKLILEADDIETIEAAKALRLACTFEIIRVPHSLPRTKPKACNFALPFARGEFITIFDAEDQPEPDQLKKAVVAFRHAPPDMVCMQARLNYYNPAENWLTRMFTLEYSLWFDYFLPALERLHIPIPLGGTSNHFRTAHLRELKAWDPYNVTEDADLGVRMTQSGQRVGVLNTTTYEEANVDLVNWLRQRSRWIKGYMQTYLVHMRAPWHLYRTLGARGFLGFQLFVGGTFVTALVAPIMWAVYLLWLFTDTRAFDPFFPPLILYLSMVNLLLGNGFFIYLTLLAAFKRRLYGFAPYAFTVPLYWLLQSIAGYRAVWQLLVRPFYWEKTVHGLSRYAQPPGGARLG